jgi:hypothetical protein
MNLPRHTYEKQSNNTRVNGTRKEMVPSLAFRRVSHFQGSHDKPFEQASTSRVSRQVGHGLSVMQRMTPKWSGKNALGSEAGPPDRCSTVFQICCAVAELLKCAQLQFILDQDDAAVVVYR